MSHVMIDLETMGLRPNAPILAIGAVEFTKEGKFLDEFYETISLKSAVEGGAVIDPDTVLWWMAQSDEARKEIITADKDIELVLVDFSRWLRDADIIKNIEGIWGNGPAFDNAMLMEAYRRHGLDDPWSHKLDRCYRTKRAEDSVPVAAVFEGTEHNALDDAKNQARHLIEIWREQGL